MAHMFDKIIVVKNFKVENTFCVLLHFPPKAPYPLCATLVMSFDSVASKQISKKKILSSISVKTEKKLDFTFVFHFYTTLFKKHVILRQHQILTLKRSIPKSSKKVHHKKIMFFG
jgi:hypothetical protein